jgi:hypothetical protein
MYFTTFNYYDNEELCLICWENKNIHKMKSLLHSSLYYTYCNCNGNFHHDCLLKWIKKTNSCPICRIKIEIDEPLPLTFKISKLFKLFFTFILIKILYDIIFEIQYAAEKKYRIQNEEL